MGSGTSVTRGYPRRGALTEPADEAHRLAAMQTLRRLTGLLSVVVLAAACSGGAASAPPTAVPSPDPNTPVTNVPGDSGR